MLRKIKEIVNGSICPYNNTTCFVLYPIVEGDKLQNLRYVKIPARLPRRV